jgi:hypothetical protein
MWGSTGYVRSSLFFILAQSIFHCTICLDNVIHVSKAVLPDQCWNFCEIVMQMYGD